MKIVINKILLAAIASCMFLSLDAQSVKSREHYLDEVKYYDQKIKQEPDNISYYYLRATFHHVLTNFHESKADFKKVLEIYSANPAKKLAVIATDACYFLADDYFFRRSERNTAQKYVEQGLNISPEDKRFEVLQTGILGTYPEKQQEVTKKFESLIAKYPGDMKILLYYAKFLEKIDLEKSVSYYEKVTAINPHNTDALFALGSYHVNEASRVYRTTGDARKGLELFKTGAYYFEKIHKLRPDDQEIIEILIQTYGNMNMDEEQVKMERKLSQLSKAK